MKRTALSGSPPSLRPLRPNGRGTKILACATMLLLPVALAAQTVLLLAPAADGQEPQPTALSAQAFECETVSVPDRFGVVPERQRVGAPATSSTVVIDLLVLYSEAARSVGLGTFDDALVEANRAYSESGARVLFRRVGAEPLRDLEDEALRFEESTRSTRHGPANELLHGMLTSQWVDAARREAGADLVVAWTDRLSDGVGTGKAYVGVGRSSGFAVVGFRTHGTWLLAHEIGHNLGLSHQDGYVFDLGYGFPYRTVMAVGAAAPILAFSRDSHGCSSDLICGYFGRPEHRSVDAINETAPIVGAYEHSTVPYEPPVNAMLDGFEVGVRYSTSGSGRWRSAKLLPVDLPGQSSALFYFFDPSNAEMLVKVQDGCGVNRHWWVYAASATDVGFETQVKNTRTGAIKTYTNDPGNAPPALTDSVAFPCEP